MDWKGFEDEKQGGINIHHTVFQQGRNLYECQVLLAHHEAGKPMNETKVADLLKEMCALINGVGQLRAEYDRMREALTALKKDIRRVLGE
jgi:hypothetical protein